MIDHFPKIEMMTLPPKLSSIITEPLWVCRKRPAVAAAISVDAVCQAARR